MLNHSPINGSISRQFDFSSDFWGPSLPRRTIIPESRLENPQPSSEKRLILLSKELEEAANLFLLKIEELEKLLPLIDE
jgi:hypothetical protein